MKNLIKKINENKHSNNKNFKKVVILNFLINQSLFKILLHIAIPTISTPTEDTSDEYDHRVPTIQSKINSFLYIEFIILIF
jgi:hypothetical protein